MNDQTGKEPNWLDGWLRRPVAILSWTVAILVAGIWMAFQVPLEWVPIVELPEIRISTFWPGASPRAVERYVTAPVERAVQGVTGTAHVESYSEEGFSTVILSVSEKVRLGSYFAEINEHLARLRNVLPDRVTPRLTKSVPEALRDEQGFMTLELVGTLHLDELRSLADELIAPKLRSIPGISEVFVEGGTEHELLVSLDSDKLAAYGISPSEVRMTLFEATTDAAYGCLHERGRSMLLLSPGEDDVEKLRALVLRQTPGGLPLRLSDMAGVSLGPAPVQSISRIDGRPVVALILDRASGSHMTEVAHSVRQRVETLRGELSGDVYLSVAFDRSEDVRAQLQDLTWQGGIGFLLVELVLLFMLRSVRAALVVLFAVVVSLAVALALLGPLGLTLNLLTIAGLVLVFGLMVDNAVVVVEQLLANRRGDDAEAALSALKAVWLPLVGGTLTTMIVVVPLVYLSGELRAFFLPFGVLVSLTLGASLLSAALLVPVLGRFLPVMSSPGRHLTFAGPRHPVSLFAALYAVPTRLPRLILTLLVLTLGIPLWLLPSNIVLPEEGRSSPVHRLAGLYNATIDSETMRDVRKTLDVVLGGVLRPFVQQVSFGPHWQMENRPEVYVSLHFPPGNPIERADSLLGVFERTALASDAVSRTIASVAERQATLRVQFTEGSLRTSEPYVLRERLIKRAFLLAGIGVTVSGLLPEGYHSSNISNRTGFVLEAYGPAYDDLTALCEDFGQRLRQASRRVFEVDINRGRYGYVDVREVLRLQWNADAEARTGGRAYQIAAALEPVFSTRFPALYANLEGESHLPVRIVVNQAERTDIERILARPLKLGDSLSVRLAGYSIEQVPSGIERSDQQYKRYLSVDWRGPWQIGSELIERELEAFEMPPGYRIEQANYLFFTGDVRESFGWVFLATIGLVFLVIVIVFESWKLPLVVMLSIPLAAIGVAVGFLWSGAHFAEGAFIGVVLLVGIAVNDSILLVDRFRQLRLLRPHAPAGLLAQRSVRDRLRPMWTTSLTTIVTMLPLLVFSQESDFWMGLAVTVVGGLLASTLLAPLATVAVLSLRRTNF